MAQLENSQQILNDIIFRAGEIPGSSDWDDQAITYLNRVYRSLCMGASEFLPEYVDDWWWLRAVGNLVILPPYNDGTVSVVQGTDAIVFSSAPPIDLTGRRFRVNGHPDAFLILSHVGVNATLDMSYTGDTNAAGEYQAMQTTYVLSTAVNSIMSPVISFRENPQIMGMQPERMDTLFPLAHLGPGVPMAFCLENEQTIRFSHGGLANGMSMRMEYRYKPVVVDLENTTLSIPMVPLQYRHILSDMALTYIMVDKNDNRAEGILSAARVSLSAMVRENRRRVVKIDGLAGSIQTRPGQMGSLSRALRTESGLIIG